MKRCKYFRVIALLIFTIITSNVVAQKGNTSEDSFKAILKLSFKNYYTPQVSKIQKGNNKFGNKIGESGTFDVYRLRIDNMPCLIPNITIEPEFRVFISPDKSVQIPNAFY